ncbi:TonB-dependent receptor [Winogradskyella sp. DF17]|jgi:TonB-linked SusC/RagA family outer membrane protein|uniref:TonB-dependent receptor n=1 Tax=Winogradskyella pelagia TaxID=2819984 RepID=A0ABS3T2N5_9FLAO|nr:TonB-dependent receptor [Winogradskyella sp. DF17]MBO3116997.1 TonB-dependent receptor [Winogradskyella sp. DF17]
MKLKLTWLLTLFMAFVMQFSFAQEKSVTGTVTIASDGLPLPGANVIVKGTSRGTQTDFDGNYSINVNVGDVLVISYVGLKSTNITIGAANKYDVALEADNTLEEVVVTGYTRETRATTTSAVSTVSAEAVESRPNASIAASLQGQVPGLNIGTGSGQPGANSVILLRGIGSINGNIEPLFVIDGVPVDEDNFRSLNNNDIANITVLKDASASALYGNRGANGAIIITTKKGTFSENLQINYRGQFGYSVLPDKNFDVMNSPQKLRYNRTINNGALGSGLSDAQINAIARQANTDWEDVFFRPGETISHNLSLSSGSELMSSFTSLGYFEQKGVTLRSDIQRFNLRQNLNGKSSNGKFNYGTTLSLNFSTNNFIQNEGTGNLSNPFLVPYVALPYFSQFNPDGTLNTVGSGLDDFDNTPFTALNNTVLNTNRTEEIKFIGSVFADYEFMKNVTASIRFGLDYTYQRGQFIEDPTSVYGQTAAAAGDAEFQGTNAENYSRDARFNNLVGLNYNNVFGEKHNVDFSAFMEYNKAYLNTSGFTQVGLNPKVFEFGTGFIPATTFEDLDGDGLAATDGTEFPYIPGISLNEITVGIFSYFGVLRYTYDDRFNFQGSVRRDASSRFSESNRWGTFWSVSGSWNITNESWMDNSVFSNLKLRASYGVTGNDRISGGFYGSDDATFDLYGQGAGYNNTVGLFATQIGNKDLKWETITQTNIGLDFGLFNNKLTGSFDVYEKVTDDLFQSQPVSALNGVNTIFANQGQLTNTGAEVALNWTALSNPDGLTLSFFANGSYNVNEITELPGGIDEVLGGGRTNSLRVGKQLGEFFAVRWAGVNPANGNPLYLDIDGNVTETYNVDNRVWTDKTIYPTYQGGFGFNAGFKGFTLDTQFSWVADIYRYNGSLGVIEDPTLTTLSNGSTSFLRQWQQPGDVTDIPRAGSPSTRNLLTDRYLEDASFLRLRNIVLGYNFADALKDSNFIQNIKVFLQAENLFTWSKWRGWDPESSFRNSDFFDYPTTQIFTIGVDLTF